MAAVAARRQGELAMKRVILAVAGIVLAGCGAQVSGVDGFKTQFIGAYGGGAPAVMGSGVVRTAVATETVAQPVVVAQQATVTRPVVTSSVVAQNVPVTQLVPQTSIVQVPRVVPQVVPIQQQVTIPQLASVPVQRPLIYQQYCSPWVAQGVGGLGYMGLGLF